jgi:hypothetical protein
MSLRKVLQLNNDITIPQIGLGTWLSKPHEVENAVRCIYVRICAWITDMSRGAGRVGSGSRLPPP